MPAIVGIIAKIMALVERALESFVTITVVNQDYEEGICAPAYFATVTNCGDQVAHLWEKMIYQVSALGVNLMSALGVSVPNP